MRRLNLHYRTIKVELYFIGKPQPEMVELALQRNHYRKEDMGILNL